MEYHIIPVEEETNHEFLIELPNLQKCHLILTTGGSGFDDRSVTLKATKRVLVKEVLGIHERIRAGTLTFTKYAILSRGTAFIRGVSLIINFPGSPNGVKECFDVVKDTLPLRSSW